MGQIIGGVASPALNSISVLKISNNLQHEDLVLTLAPFGLLIVPSPPYLGDSSDISTESKFFYGLVLL